MYGVRVGLCVCLDFMANMQILNSNETAKGILYSTNRRHLPFLEVDQSFGSMRRSPLRSLSSFPQCRTLLSNRIRCTMHQSVRDSTCRSLHQLWNT